MNNYIRTSDPAFAAGMFPLPAPDILELVERRGSNPHHAGLYEFKHCFVNEDGGLSGLSPSTMMQLKENSSYGVRFSHEQWSRATAIMLFCRRVDGTPGVTAHAMEYEWRPAGAQLNCNNAQSTPRPNLPMVGWTNHLLQAQEIDRCSRLTSGQGWNTYDEMPHSSGPTPTIAPTIIPYHVPSQSFDVRLRYVGYNSSMSLPSPVLTVPVESFGAGDFHSPFELRKRGRLIQGVKGYYLEMKPTDGTQWYRQKNPAQDGYLWDFVQTHFEPKNYSDEFAVLDPIDEAPGQVYLCSLQRCLSESTLSIIVDEDQETYSPIFNGTDNGRGTAINRIIRGEQGLRWKIIPKNNEGDLNTDWPAFVEASAGTIIDGIQIESATAKAGIDFCAYNDSAAFRPRISNYSIALTGDGYRAGARQIIEARAVVPPGTAVYNKDQHTCSEPIFSNGFIGARHPIVVEGGQSANWIFEHTHISGSDDCDSAIASVNNNGVVRFTGQTVMERARAALAVISGRYIEIENFSSDKGFPSLACVSNRSDPIIKINCSVPNQPKTWIHLVEAMCSGRGAVEFTMTGRMDAKGVEIDGSSIPTIATINTSRYVGVRYRIGNHCEFGDFVLNQPTKQWWQTAMADFAYARSYCESWDGGFDRAQMIVPDVAYGM